jgi:hypothetical protein
MHAVISAPHRRYNHPHCTTLLSHSDHGSPQPHRAEDCVSLLPPRGSSHACGARRGARQGIYGCHASRLDTARTVGHAEIRGQRAPVAICTVPEVDPRPLFAGGASWRQVVAVHVALQLLPDLRPSLSDLFGFVEPSSESGDAQTSGDPHAESIGAFLLYALPPAPLSERLRGMQNQRVAAKEAVRPPSLL